MKEITHNIINHEVETLLMADQSLVNYVKRNPEKLKNVIHKLSADDKEILLSHFSNPNSHNLENSKLLLAYGAGITINNPNTLETIATLIQQMNSQKNRR